MKTLLAAAFSGLLFGVGLGVSGMTQADKVIGFLDLTDAWDPSLALVMLGAILVHLFAFRKITGRPSPLFAERFGIPTRTDIDGRLVGGAALFGVGWALGGYCPGPGLVSSMAGGSNALVFVAGLSGGMLLFHLYDEASSGAAAPSEPTPTPIEPRHVGPTGR